MESLPHDVIENILERLDVKSLLKFKLVSKQWNATIKSRSFRERHSSHPRQSGNPDVLLVSACDKSFSVETMRTFMLGSSVSVKFPTPWENTLYRAGNNTCDGLICLIDQLLSKPNMVVNPTIRWLRAFPYSTYQLLKQRRELMIWQTANLGFGKDKISGTYKAVWLYNSYELFLTNNNNVATDCEVFDFTTNAWRYVVPSSPYPIFAGQDPLYLEGSLHWFANKSHEPVVLSLDLHTETFQVLSKTPFLHQGSFRGMCNLDDRLCVYEEKHAQQVIWSFDSEHKTWEKIYSIDLISVSSIRTCFTLKPLAVVDKEKLLVCDANFGVELLIYDPRTQSCELAFTSKDYITAYHLCYFPTFISIM